jgi:hypothetical protein
VNHSFNSVSAIEVGQDNIPQPFAGPIRFFNAIPLGSDTVSASALQSLQAGMQRTLKFSLLSSKNTIQVAIDEDTLVLRGIVKNEHELLLAEAVARLTPGVRYLRNELAVPLSARNNGSDRKAP